MWDRLLVNQERHSEDEPESAAGFFHCPLNSCKLCVNAGVGGAEYVQPDNEDEIPQFLECDTPPGQGKGLAVIIRKIGKIESEDDAVRRILLQSDTQTPSKVDYAAPAFVLMAEHDNLAVIPPGGSTAGGTILTLFCQDCGSPPRADAQRRASAAFSNRHEVFEEPSVLIGGRPCIPIVKWHNDSISCVVPAGIGLATVSLQVAGQSATGSFDKKCLPSYQGQIADPNSVHFKYSAPVIQSVTIFSSGGETLGAGMPVEYDGMCGGALVVVSGFEFGENLTKAMAADTDAVSDKPSGFVRIGDEMCTVLK